jgi:hypothetical protein
MKVRSTPEIDNMFLKAVELCDKYELQKEKPVLDALQEMYREGVVYAIKTTNQLRQDMEEM